MTYDDQNIFAKILRGEIPCAKVYEDDLVLAFMDVMPQAEGHTLVVPKAPARGLLDVAPDTLAALIVRVQKVAAAVKAAFARRRPHDPAVQRAGRRPERVPPALPRRAADGGRGDEAARRRHGGCGVAEGARGADQGSAVEASRCWMGRRRTSMSGARPSAQLVHDRVDEQSDTCGKQAAVGIQRVNVEGLFGSAAD